MPYEKLDEKAVLNAIAGPAFNFLHLSQKTK